MPERPTRETASSTVEVESASLVIEARYEPDAFPGQSRLPDLEGNVEARDIRFDLQEIFRKNILFYRDSNLPTFADALEDAFPKGLELTDVQKDACREAAEQGFDFPLILPPIDAFTSLAEGDQEKAMKYVYGEMSTDLSGEKSKPKFPDPSRGSFPPISKELITLLQGRPYIRFFHSGNIPAENLGLGSESKKQEQQDAIPFTYHEFAIAEQMQFEQNGNHKWGSKEHKNGVFCNGNVDSESDPPRSGKSVWGTADTTCLAAGWIAADKTFEYRGTRPSRVVIL